MRAWQGHAPQVICSASLSSSNLDRFLAWVPEERRPIRSRQVSRLATQQSSQVAWALLSDEELSSCCCVAVAISDSFFFAGDNIGCLSD